jgi:hypothetical protein
MGLVLVIRSFQIRSVFVYNLDLTSFVQLEDVGIMPVQSRLPVEIADGPETMPN